MTNKQTGTSGLVERGPARIWLEPPCNKENRLWCEDNVWPTDDADLCPDCIAGGVEYVRADLASLSPVPVDEVELSVFTSSADIALAWLGKALIDQGVVEHVRKGDLHLFNSAALTASRSSDDGEVERLKAWAKKVCDAADDLLAPICAEAGRLMYDAPDDDVTPHLPPLNASLFKALYDATDRSAALSSLVGEK